MKPASLIEFCNCKICDDKAALIGTKIGKFAPRVFHFYRCRQCGFVFVGDPWTDYGTIYSEAYYRGQGADPYIDYVFELEHPEKTIRIYEWRGITRAVRSFVPLSQDTRWLDFGCGNGGLVRHVREAIGCLIAGYEQGWIHDAVQRLGVPLLREDQLPERQGYYDVITAIEVLEHVSDPKAVLRVIRSLLRPGGLLFLTTGNLAKYRRNPLKWSYALPEIHISLYEPRTLAWALRQTGFRPAFHGYSSGFPEIIRFKILKNLGVRETTSWERFLPWPVLARLAETAAGVAQQPIGWAS